MALLHYLWSRVAGSNATSDAQINWAEGMAPSAVNDSARAMMASLAGYRDDIAGAIVTGGTSTAYTVTSYQVFDTLAHMGGQVIAFTPHATNGATVTLNVDGLGAKPLRSAPSVELTAGTLILGTPYTALYNASDAVWYLHNFYVNPYQIPLGGGMDYWLPTAPNSAFVFAYGQAISRTTYATLFALMGTTYGAGDGSTTFNLPDKRDRISAGKSNMGGTYASRLGLSFFGADPGVLGSVGGVESHTLTLAQLASHGHNGTTGTEDAAHTHAYTAYDGGSVNAGGGFGGSASAGTTGTESQTHRHGFTTDAAGGGAAHNNVQPTIICNYILRVL